jgi:hypothetical protein
VLACLLCSASLHRCGVDSHRRRCAHSAAGRSHRDARDVVRARPAGSLAQERAGAQVRRRHQDTTATVGHQRTHRCTRASMSISSLAPATKRSDERSHTTPADAVPFLHPRPPFVERHRPPAVRRSPRRHARRTMRMTHAAIRPHPHWIRRRRGRTCDATRPPLRSAADGLADCNRINPTGPAPHMLACVCSCIFSSIRKLYGYGLALIGISAVISYKISTSG